MRLSLSTALLIPCFVIGLSDPSQAQSPWLDFEVDAPRQLGLGLEPTETLGACIAGDITGDLRTDAFLHLDDRVHFVYGPGLFEADRTWPLTVDSVATVSTAAGATQAVTTSARGLELRSYDPIQTTFPVTLLDAGPWLSAKDLHVGDFNGDGKPDGIAIRADGIGLVRCQDLLGAAQVSEHSLGATVHGIQTLEWDGSPGLELALSSANSVSVVESNGSVLASFPPIGASGRVSALSGDGLPQDLLLVLREDGSGDQFLETRAHSGASSTLALGALDAYGLVPGDLDGDGLQDVAVAMHSTGEILLLRTHPAGPQLHSLAAEEHLWVGDPELRGGSMSTPALADFDNDGDLDLLIPDHNDGILDLRRNGAIDHTTLMPAVLGGIIDFGPGGAGGSVDLNVIQPTAGTFPVAHTEIQVWRRSSYDVPTDADSLEQVLYLPAASANATIQIEAGFENSDIVYSLECRIVELDADGAVTDARPAHVYALGESDPLTELAIDHGIPNPVITYLSEAGPGLGSGAGVTPIGCVPCHEDEDLPRPRGD